MNPDVSDRFRCLERLIFDGGAKSWSASSDRAALCRASAYGPPVALDDRPCSGKEPTITAEARHVGISGERQGQGARLSAWVVDDAAAGHGLQFLVKRIKPRKVRTTRNVATLHLSGGWQRSCASIARCKFRKRPGAKSRKPRRRAAIIRRKAANPGHRGDGVGLAAPAGCPRLLRARP